MSEQHTTTVKPIRRTTHDLQRTVFVVRCNGCTYRLETTDEGRANREALRHEASVRVVAGVVSE